MKKILTLVVTVFLATICLAHNIQAANVSFNPSVVRVKVAPGEVVHSSLAARGFSTSPYMMNLRIGSRLAGGNIPRSWINPVDLVLSSSTGGPSSSTVNFAVLVPPGAMPGIYNGRVQPEILQTSQPVSSQGFVVSIEVAEPETGCAGLPEFADFSISPDSYWAPAEQEVEISLSGTVKVSPGCQVRGTYELESNNGLVQGSLTLHQDNSFSETIRASVSRSGQDKDGKVFKGILTAVDEEGNRSSLDFYITVLHDRGMKNGQQK